MSKSQSKPPLPIAASSLVSEASKLIDWFTDGFEGEKSKAAFGGALTLSSFVTTAVSVAASVTTMRTDFVPLLEYVCWTFAPEASNCPSFSKSQSIDTMSPSGSWAEALKLTCWPTAATPGVKSKFASGGAAITSWLANRIIAAVRTGTSVFAVAKRICASRRTIGAAGFFNEEGSAPCAHRATR